MTDIDQLWEDVDRALEQLNGPAAPKKGVVKCVNKGCMGTEEDFVESDGSNICEICGFQQSTVIESVEWVNHSSNGAFSENKSRVGLPNISNNPFKDSSHSFVPKGSYQTVDVKVCEDCRKIYPKKSNDCCDKCGSKKWKYEKKRYDMAYLNTCINKNHKEKSFDIVSNTIETYCQDRFPHSVKNTAEKLWGEIMKANKLTRGSIRIGLIACCVYYACIHNNCVKQIEYIAQIFNISVSNFHRGDKHFKDTMHNNPNWSGLVKNTLECENLFIPFLVQLELPLSYNEKCEQLNSKYSLDELNLVPKSLAVGIIFYIVKPEKKFLKTDFCKKVKICIPTLTKTEKMIARRISQFSEQRST